jgi:hypothetical protein
LASIRVSSRREISDATRTTESPVKISDRAEPRAQVDVIE